VSISWITSFICSIISSSINSIWKYASITVLSLVVTAMTLTLYRLNYGFSRCVMSRLGHSMLSGVARIWKSQDFVLCSSSRKVSVRITGCTALGHGFANCGTCTTTGMPTIVYLYAALIKISKYENR
jgi:hypothetical protein